MGYKDIQTDRWMDTQTNRQTSSGKIAYPKALGRKSMLPDVLFLNDLLTKPMTTVEYVDFGPHVLLRALTTLVASGNVGSCPQNVIMCPSYLCDFN